MKNKLSKSDVIWSYIGTILSMSANFIMLPFIMYFLDDNSLGLWYVFASVGTIATLFDCGFSVTFARNITYCWSGADSLKKEDVNFVEAKEPNFELMKKILFTCKWIYFIISSAALIAMAVGGTFYILHISHEMTGYNHIIAWFIYIIAVFLNLYFGYYTSFLRGVGAISAANINTVIARTVQIGLTVLLLFLKTGLIGACAAYLAYGTLLRVLGQFKFYRYKGIGKSLKLIITKFTFKDIKPIFSVVWHNAWKDGVISITNFLCGQASTIIASFYLSLYETGIFSIGSQIATAIAAIAGTLYNAYQPTIQEAYINKEQETINRSMSIIVMSFIYLFIVGTVLVVFAGLPLLKLVKPETVVSIPILLGLCLYNFILGFRNCYTSYYSCTNRIKYMLAFVISAIACIGLSVLFIGPLHMGAWGLVIAQIISQAVFNFWYWPVSAHREMKLSPKRAIVDGTKGLVSFVINFFRKKEANT